MENDHTNPNVPVGDQNTESVSLGHLDQEHLRILFQEYQAKDEHGRDLYRLIFQIASITILLFVGLSTYLFATEKILPEFACWLLSLAFVIPYAVVLQFIWVMILNGYYLRDIEKSIWDMTKIPIFHYHYVFARALWSFRTGSRAFKAILVLIFIAAAAVYLCVVGLGYIHLANPINNVPLQRLAVYLVVHVAFAITMVWVLVASLTTSRKLYEHWMTGADREHKLLPPRSLAFLLVRYAFMPRLSDFILKSTIYLGALSLTCFALGVSLSSDLAWTATLVFLCFEFLAKQTTYIWNDTRDFASDSLHPHKKLRPLPQLSSRQLGKVLFLIRVGASIVVSAAVSAAFRLWWVLALVAVVFTMQFIYDSWAKKGEIRKLVVAMAGYPLRTIPAILVVGSYAHVSDFVWILLLIIWATVFGLVSLSAYWWAEDDFLRRKAKLETQTWFLTRGKLVRTIGGILLFLVGAVIAAIYSEVTFSYSIPILVVGSLFGVGIPLLLRRTLNEKFRPVWLFSIIFVSALIWFFGTEDSKWFVLVLGAAMFITVLYHELLYEEINMMYFMPRLKRIIDSIDKLLFGVF